MSRDREYIVRFDGDKAHIALAAPGSHDMATRPRLNGWDTCVTDRGNYHVRASSAQRAELIARAMRKK